jgi:ribosomal protein S18 acetylase RimI-like enzyme
MHSEQKNTVSKQVVDTAHIDQLAANAALSQYLAVGEGLLVERVNRLDASFTRQVESIYMEAFPPSQREPFHRVVSAVNEGRRWLYCARASTHVCGFAITMPLPGTGMHLLEYLAVAANMRNRGIGGVLVRDVLQSLRAQGTVSGIVLEVETDEEDDPVEQRLRHRRIEFYRRIGATVIEGVKDYAMPDMRGSGSLAMKLLWLPVISSASVPDGPDLEACIVSIYQHSYGLEPDNPLVKHALASLQGSRSQSQTPPRGVING